MPRASKGVKDVKRRQKVSKCQKVLRVVKRRECEFDGVTRRRNRDSLRLSTNVESQRYQIYILVILRYLAAATTVLWSVYIYATARPGSFGAEHGTLALVDLWTIFANRKLGPKLVAAMTEFYQKQLRK
jgi:hypothetical protein